MTAAFVTRNATELIHRDAIDIVSVMIIRYSIPLNTHLVSVLALHDLQHLKGMEMQLRLNLTTTPT